MEQAVVGVFAWAALNKTGGIKTETIIVAFDLGTTHLKCLAIDDEQTIGYQSQQPTPFLSEPGIGTSAINPMAVWHFIREELRHWEGVRPVRVAFSTAMHAFLAVDEQNLPMGGAYTWMDSRAAATAWAMRPTVGESWHQKTGTPVHAMSVAVKWDWWRVAHPDRRPAKVVSLKDWVIFQLTGQWVTDWTSASGTGLLGLRDQTWNREILAAITLSSDQLPSIVSPATEIGFARGTVIVGGGDAALAHFGLGIGAASQAGVLSFGTSGAIRANIDAVPEALAANFFCYRAVDEGEYLLGEAYSNMGNVLEWIAHTYHVSVPEMVERGLRRIAQGGDFPTLVPYRYGERSPYWEERLTAQWVQVNGDETADEWFAGALAGVLAVLFGGSVRLKNRVRRLKTLRSGSRTLDQVLFATAVATVTGLELTVEEGLDASLLGAIRLASQSAWVAITRGVEGHLRYAPEPGQEAFWEARWQIISQAAAKQLDAMGLPPSPH